MRWARNLTRTGEDSNACTVLVREHDGRPRCRWEDNTKMDLKGYERVWTGFICLGIWTKSRLMNLWVA
jgi:hypothetical protein